MKVRAYKITCLTNLHMGAGTQNVGIVDLEVQRDCVTKEPTIHASGVKGALRSYAEYYAGNEEDKQEIINQLFGRKPVNGNDSEQGNLVFFDGDLVFRPCRTTSGDKPFQLCTSDEQKNLIVGKAKALGVSAEHVEALFTSEVLIDDDCLKSETLPIIAHNSIDDEGKSENVWWQEVVPHSSVFVTFVGGYGDTELNSFQELCGIGQKGAPPLQFGADRSIGLGFVTMERVDGNDKQN